MSFSISSCRTSRIGTKKRKRRSSAVISLRKSGYSAASSGLSGRMKTFSPSRKVMWRSSKAATGSREDGLSMRHQYGNRHRFQETERGTPKHKFAQARMAIATHYDHVGGGIRRVREDGGGHVYVGRRDAFDVHLETVPGKMLTKIGAGYFIAFAWLVGDDHDLDLFRLFQQRQGIGDGARGGAPAVPADHHALKFRRAFLDERHEDHGAPGLEQHTFVDDLVSRRFLPVGLANDDQIEAPPDTSDLIRGAR